MNNKVEKHTKWRQKIVGFEVTFTYTTTKTIG